MVSFVPISAMNKNQNQPTDGKQAVWLNIDDKKRIHKIQ